MSDSTTAGLEQRRLLREILARTGWTQTELAKRAGLDPSTLSRFLANEDAVQSLRASTLRKLEELMGMPLANALQQPPPVPGLGLSESEADPLPASGAGPQQIMPPQPGLDAWLLKSRSLEQLGLLPGDVLMVKLGATALRGDIVCAQVYDWPQRKAQTVFRLFDPPYLLAATAESRLMRPFEVDNENVIIKGVVMQMSRSFGPRPA
jgi:transcriptional regulator with XRE-family HTH domain